MKKTMIMMLLLWVYFGSSAQNNAIFTGGNADGWERTSYQQASNNIYTGGNGDGADRTIYLQAANNIFAGGDGDGWNRTAFAQSLNNIFTGGEGDGWDKTSFAQAANGIFNGGTGDGWDKTNYLQAGKNIFFGGVGDGWASTYRPMGPLPVTLLYFTAKKSSSVSALLEWKTSQETNASHFDAERSGDAVSFTSIGRVAATGNSSLGTAYSFTDNNPMPGNNYYRLKQVDRDGRFVYTPARLVRFDELNAASVKYYPNPTKGMLTIEITGAVISDAKLINISNAAGVVVDQLRLHANNSRFTQVDLSRYPKGIYFIQIRTAAVNSTQRVVLQ